MITPEHKDKITVAMFGLSDQPASQDKDTLGFTPYVKAVSSFLLNPKTQPPFTFSIEGEWGSGKSSFMIQLEEHLQKAGQKTVRFNAWRHDKVESMWATFALHFIKKLSKSLELRKRIRAFIHLYWSRYDFKRGWLPLISFSFLLTIYALILVTFFKAIYLHGFYWLNTLLNEKGEINWLNIFSLSGGAGFVLLGGFLLRNTVNVLSNPLEIDLRKFISEPEYKENSAFIEEFHEDFELVVNALAKDINRIYVFIDDLDRAAIPKAADLMHGLNMMMSDSSKLVFIIGNCLGTQFANNFLW